MLCFLTFLERSMSHGLKFVIKRPGICEILKGVSFKASPLCWNIPEVVRIVSNRANSDEQWSLGNALDLISSVN